MKHLRFLSVALLALFFGLAPRALAIPITMDFAVGGFSPSAPIDSISGAFTWDAPSVYGQISSLTSVSLSIDGHDYTLEEVGFMPPFVYTLDLTLVLIGGVASGGAGVIISPGVDDFSLRWERNTLTPYDFNYVSSGQSGGEIWSSRNFTSFSLTEAAPVPEPATMLLLSAGLFGLAGLKRRFIE